MKYYVVKLYDGDEDENLIQCWSIYDCKIGDEVRVDVGVNGRIFSFGRVESETTVREVESFVYPIFSNETTLEKALVEAKTKRDAREALRKLIVNKLSEDDFKTLLKAVQEVVPDAQFLIDQYMKSHVTTQ